MLEEHLSIKDEPEDVFGQENIVTGNLGGEDEQSNAFNLLMNSRRDAQTWSNAASTEAKNFGKVAAVRKCPFYKIMDIEEGVAVDAFHFGSVPNVSMYFLSYVPSKLVLLLSTVELKLFRHFHSDHYGGLYSSWTHGDIYCSEVTGRLVMKQLRVDPSYVKMLPMNEKIQIGKFYVTLIDANQ